VVSELLKTAVLATFSSQDLDRNIVSATVDFQQRRPCWIKLFRQCVPGFRNTV